MRLPPYTQSHVRDPWEEVVKVRQLITIQAGYAGRRHRQWVCAEVSELETEANSMGTVRRHQAPKHKISKHAGTKEKWKLHNFKAQIRQHARTWKQYTCKRDVQYRLWGALNAQPHLGDFDLQVTTDAECQCNKEKAHGWVLVVGPWNKFSSNKTPWITYS